MCNNCNSSVIPTGTDGENAFTVTTASFLQPAVNTNVTVSVSNAGQYTGIWAITGQLIYIESAGYFEVVSSTATSITAKYTASYATINQALTASGNSVAANKKVSPAGIIGSSGTNGTDGVIIYDSYIDLTGVGNDATISEDSLRLVSIAANTLSTNGDYLDIDIYYSYTDNDQVNMRFKFGGSTIVSYEEFASDVYFNKISIQITRISNTSQMWIFTKQAMNSTSGSSYVYVKQTSSTATLSSSNDFEITAENLASGANQVVLKKCVIKKISI